MKYNTSKMNKGGHLEQESSIRSLDHSVQSRQINNLYDKKAFYISFI